jgi:hypothetical protein
MRLASLALVLFTACSSSGSDGGAPAQDSALANDTAVGIDTSAADTTSESSVDSSSADSTSSDTADTASPDTASPDTASEAADETLGEAGTACTTNADCAFGYFCDAANCDGPGTCTKKPGIGVFCKMDGTWCGCDHYDYTSECAAHKAGVRVAHSGGC